MIPIVKVAPHLVREWGLLQVSRFPAQACRCTCPELVTLASERGHQRLSRAEMLEAGLGWELGRTYGARSWQALA